MSAQKASKDVIVANQPGQPVPTQAIGVTTVRAADDPALQPFQTRVMIDLAAGENGANAFVAVPAGKRVVIEYASAFGDAPTDQVLTFSVGTKIPGETVFTMHSLPATQQDAVGNTSKIFVAGSPVRLYADPPHTLLRVDRTASTGSVRAWMSISGYLIDLPQQ